MVARCRGVKPTVWSNAHGTLDSSILRTGSGLCFLGLYWWVDSASRTTDSRSGRADDLRAMEGEFSSRRGLESRTNRVCGLCSLSLVRYAQMELVDMHAQLLIGLMCLGACLLTSVQDVVGQRSRPMPLSRAHRVVIHSPHFDEPDPEQGVLNCPAKPAQMFGFESDEVHGDSVSKLRVRVLSWLAPEPGVVRNIGLNGALLQLTHQVVGGSEQQLPRTARYAGITGSNGGLDISVPPGVYRLKVAHIGYRSGEGVIQFRQFAHDSLHVYLDQAAICAP